MFNRINRDLNEIIVGCEEQHIVNSEECSDLDITYTAMMLFNNGYVVMMDTSSMMDNTIQVTIQPSTAKHLIYYYFSSTFEMSVFGHCKATMVNKVLELQSYLHYLNGDTQAMETL